MIEIYRYFYDGLEDAECCPYDRYRYEKKYDRWVENFEIRALEFLKKCVEERKNYDRRNNNN